METYNRPGQADQKFDKDRSRPPGWFGLTCYLASDYMQIGDNFFPVEESEGAKVVPWMPFPVC